MAIWFLVNMLMTEDERGPVILFDGVCNLCTGTVRFIINRDAAKKFRFASLQSAVAKEMLGSDSDVIQRMDSIVLIDNDGIWHKSTAAIRAARRLSGLWPLVGALLIVPRLLRDGVYDFVGARRYRLFGRTNACWLPDVDCPYRLIVRVDFSGIFGIDQLASRDD